MLDISRGLSEADRFMRRGDWMQRPFRLATRLSRKKLGIVGLGRIGRAVARRGQGFDMEIRYHNRRPVEGVEYRYMDDLKALARWSDFLMIAVAGGADTQHLVSADVIAELGAGGYLINVARGSAVDGEALTRALQSRAIAGAALDVFATEPCFPEELCALENVVLLPHIGTATHETRAAMGDSSSTTFIHSSTPGGSSHRCRKQPMQDRRQAEPTAQAHRCGGCCRRCQPITGQSLRAWSVSPP